VLTSSDSMYLQKPQPLFMNLRIGIKKLCVAWDSALTGCPFLSNTEFFDTADIISKLSDRKVLYSKLLPGITSTK
jgi:hypothetical protein